MAIRACTMFRFWTVATCLVSEGWFFGHSSRTYGAGLTVILLCSHSRRRLQS